MATKVETIRGTSIGELLVGGAEDELIDGLGGEDVIDAGGGDDRVVIRGLETLVIGGSGEDTLVIAGRVGTFFLGEPSQVVGVGGVIGFEHIDASKAPVAVDISGSDGTNRLIGGRFGDTIFGGFGIGEDTIRGGAGNDLVFAAPGDFDLDGGSGIDRLVFHDIVFGAADLVVKIDLGNARDQAPLAEVRLRNFEHVSALEVSNPNFRLDVRGSSGPNILRGGAGADTLAGLGGNDTIEFHADDDNLSGGAGSDTLLVRAAGLVSLDLREPANQLLNATGSSAVVLEFEHVDASSRNVTLRVDGSNGSNRIVGGVGDDTIDGRAGRDVIDGGAGADEIAFSPQARSLEGGDGGFDRLVIAKGATFSVNGDRARFGGTDTKVTGFEIFDASGAAGRVTIRIVNDFGSTFLGSAFDDIVEGLTEFSTIFAGGGNDRVRIGFSGFANIDGGPGDDTMVIDREFQVVNLASSFEQVAGLRVAGFEHVDGSRGRELTVLGSSASNRIIGTNMVDQLEGRDGDDTIFGGGGADVLVPGAGRDSLRGGAGNDLIGYSSDDILLDGGSGRDFLVLDGATGVVDIDLNRKTDQVLSDEGRAVGFEAVSSFGFLGDLSIVLTNRSETFSGSIGNDTISGGSGNDLIFGGAGDDALNGGAGADTLVGEIGQATMTGGTGADFFDFTDQFGLPSGGFVTDFNATAGDRIGLASIDGNVTVAGFQGLNFIGTGDFANAAEARFEIDIVGNRTIIELNLDENIDDSELTITLTGIHVLAGADLGIFGFVR